jgi:hypothetical protein
MTLAWVPIVARILMGQHSVNRFTQVLLQRSVSVSGIHWRKFCNVIVVRNLMEQHSVNRFTQVLFQRSVSVSGIHWRKFCNVIVVRNLMEQHSVNEIYASPFVAFS